MVHQHFDLIGPVTVFENVVLGAEPTRGPLLDRKKARVEVAALAERSGLAIDPGQIVETLSVAGQQRVEILKALYRGARLLILDEPTAVLSPAEARDLWAIVETLSSQGRSVRLHHAQTRRSGGPRRSRQRPAARQAHRAGNRHRGNDFERAGPRDGRRRKSTRFRGAAGKTGSFPRDIHRAEREGPDGAREPGRGRRAGRDPRRLPRRDRGAGGRRRQRADRG